MNIKKIAIYAFSGDPITYGHINIIEKALDIFDEIIVAIGINPDKKYTFTSQERLSLTKEALRDLNDVSVESFEGLLVDFARSKSVKHIIRGIRNSVDYAYEQNLFNINKDQYKDIETLFLFADKKYEHVSSSAVKEIQKNYGNVISYVPLCVKKALEKKINDQVFVGITGEMSSGKSYVAEYLASLYPRIYNIDLDLLAHQILKVDEEPIYHDFKLALVDRFGTEILKPKGFFVNTKMLSHLMFNHNDAPNALLFYNEHLRPAMMFKIRQTIKNKQGLIIINSALLAEENLAPFVNNKVILVSNENELIGKHPKEEILKRKKFQLSYMGKKDKILNSIESFKYGEIYEYKNIKDDPDEHEKIKSLFERITI